MRFSSRMIAFSLAPVAALAAAAFLGVATNWSAERRFEQYFERDQARAEAVQEMYAQGLQMGQALRNILLDASNKTGHANLEAAGTAYEDAAARAAKLAEGDPAAAVLAEVAGFRARQKDAQARIRELIRTDEPAAIRLLNAEETPAWREMRKRLIELSKQARTDTAQMRAEAMLATRNATWLVIGGVALALVLALMLTLLMRRQLLGQLGGEPEVARGLVDAVARGDLSTRVPLRGGDADSLLAHLEKMRQSLTGTIGELRLTMQQVANASVEIAQGNDDLAARTEQQAGSLQQTASNVAHMSEVVRGNADAARQADLLAAEASQVARKGGEVVGEVVSTMSQISEASRRISEIIGVIDGIAFQTNILALNAAVEAARAGEQGRGFAVVAGEVRSLAQRSAQAAREIKGLIGDSVGKVDDGSRLANDAGATMQEIVNQVQRVTQLIAEITAATRDQSGGIDQLSEAMGRLDAMTQQNAALVEQSTAAAQSLKDQSRRLSAAVEVFRLATA